MNELEFNKLLAFMRPEIKQVIEQKIREHERRETLRRAAERNCEWWRFISEEQQNCILNSCIEICDILEKTVIPSFYELWERLKEDFSVFAERFSESMQDFAKMIEEMQKKIYAADDRKKTSDFFKSKKRINNKIKNFTPPEKRKLRKWRHSVYGRR